MVRIVGGTIHTIVPATATVMAQGSKSTAVSTKDESPSFVSNSPLGNLAKISSQNLAVAIRKEKSSSSPLLDTPFDSNTKNSKNKAIPVLSKEKSVSSSSLATPFGPRLKTSLQTSSSMPKHDETSPSSMATPFGPKIKSSTRRTSSVSRQDGTTSSSAGALFGPTIKSSKLRQSLPTVFSPKPMKLGLPSNISKRSESLPLETTAPVLTGVDPDLKFGAKPSEIRAAAKGNREKARVEAKEKREKAKLEQMRKDQIRQREAEAALRIKRIKDEINSIKEKEREQDEEAVAAVLRERCDYSKAQAAAAELESSGGPRGLPSSRASARDKPREEHRTNQPPLAPERKRSKVEEEEDISRGNKELALEEMMAERSSAQHQKNEFERLQRLLGEQARMEMEALHMDMPMDELDAFTKQISHSPVSADVPPAPKQVEGSTPTRGRVRGTPSFRGVERQPSNRVPEMRRRANQRDLLFDEDDTDHKRLSNTDDKDKDESEATTEAEVLEAETKSENETNSKSDATTSSGATDKKHSSKSKPKSSMMAAREAREAAKLEEERRMQEEQKVELEKAKDHFDKGHDLCWKSNNPAGALTEYRKALFTRETVLGKYHEETGRSYFWIGKSLTKLRDYEEALMAFSRAMRIFQRVLHQSNKYNIWSATAVESVFRQMDNPGTDFTSYKANLEASIRHEQTGDQHRKKGKLADAIAEYREAIDNLEEYHPDAADLYCKIAIILRQQGEFERALEEYRYASEIYELSLGAEHPETVKTLNQLIEKKRLNQKSLALMEKLNMRKAPS